MIPANEQKINPSLEIARLTHYGLQTGLIEPSDVPYVRNRSCIWTRLTRAPPRKKR